MSEAISQQVTKLLSAWRGGDGKAQDELFEMLYADLHRLAHRHMANERLDHTLQTTTLINEAYLRLIDITKVEWQDRGHFFAMAAQVMRRILVDSARRHQYEKRGGGAVMVSFDEALLVTERYGADLVLLDDALTALASMDPRKSQVVELRFFGGLSLEETAEALGVSTDTVGREWKMAKVWLLREIKRQPDNRVES